MKTFDDQPILVKQIQNAKFAGDKCSSGRTLLQTTKMLI